MIPGHMHLNTIAQQVKYGVYQGGGRLGLDAAYGNPVAAPGKVEIETVGDLAQVFVERAAQVGQLLVGAFKPDGNRRDCAAGR